MKYLITLFGFLSICCIEYFLIPIIGIPVSFLATFLWYRVIHSSRISEDIFFFACMFLILDITSGIHFGIISLAFIITVGTLLSIQNTFIFHPNQHIQNGVLALLVTLEYMLIVGFFVHSLFSLILPTLLFSTLGLSLLYIGKSDYSHNAHRQI